jgi:ferredoxin
LTKVLTELCASCIVTSNLLPVCSAQAELWPENNCVLLPDPCVLVLIAEKFSMAAPAFVTGVGALASSRHYICPTQTCRRAAPRPSAVPSAVAYKPSASTFADNTVKAQTFTIKVTQGDRCTIVKIEEGTDLRRALIKEKVDVYTFGGKLRNCGGGGQCGTCLVAFEEGLQNTNEKSPKEEIMLASKPANWRLACRTLVYGDITIKTKPRA